MRKRFNLQKYDRLKLKILLLYSADDDDDENDDDDERGPGICRRLISRPVRAGRCWDGDRDRDDDGMGIEWGWTRD